MFAGEMGNTVNFVDSTTSFPVDLQAGFDFFYLKCVSGDDIKLSLDGGSNYLVSLSSGEAFASYVDSSAADIKFDSTGSSKAQYLTIT